ncbi:hypothetical protein [Micromonospora polyrhachis]
MEPFFSTPAKPGDKFQGYEVRTQSMDGNLERFLSKDCGAIGGPQSTWTTSARYPDIHARSARMNQPNAGTELSVAGQPLITESS